MDDERSAAYENLTRAVSAYYAVSEPTSYIETWVMVSHVRSSDWEQAGTSAVCILASPETTWLSRRALLDVALQREQDKIRK